MVETSLNHTEEVKLAISSIGRTFIGQVDGKALSRFNDFRRCFVNLNRELATQYEVTFTGL